MANESNTADPSSQHPPDWFKESRKKDPSTSGSIVFTALRLLELPWQYCFLGLGLGTSLLTRLGARLEPLPSSTTTLGLGLHPYHAIILGLAAGTSASQIFWAWKIRDNYFPPVGATAVALYNTFLNTVNSTLALWAVTSQAPSRPQSTGSLRWSLPVVVGIQLYMLGTYLERFSEIHRKAFKSKPENKGKPYAGRHFSIARNINYTGYALMRTGYALVCGGWVWGAIMGAINFGDFAFRAVPWLEGYCEGKVSLVLPFCIDRTCMLTTEIVRSTMARGQEEGSISTYSGHLLELHISNSSPCRTPLQTCFFSLIASLNPPRTGGNNDVRAGGSSSSMSR